jgi:membrane protein DedA with SNARE-associated domain
MVRLGWKALFFVDLMFYSTYKNVRAMHVILLYTGMLIGIILEGEMVMLSAVIAAHRGYLNLWVVMAIGFAGTLGGDWGYFFTGRKHGKNWLDKKEKFRHKIEIVNRRLQKYPVLVILTYRFVYGLRTIIPVIIGTSGIKTRTFLTFSLVSTMFWCLLYGTLGYISGEIIKTRLAHIEDIELFIIGSLVFLGILVYVFKVKGRLRIRP